MIDASLLADRISRATGISATKTIELAQLLADKAKRAQNESLIKALLSKDSLGSHWNAVLDQKRAAFLAQYIRRRLPEASPVVLDVLSGTGKVAAELRKLGCCVFEVERLECYPNRKKNEYMIDFEKILRQKRRIDVALVITTLHHEKELDRFLAWLSQLRVKRYLVIENLRDEETSAEIHSQFDWFFNTCLNQFAEDCPEWYWTNEQWLLALSSLGTVRRLDRLTDVPGIPFPYDTYEILPQS